jgi:hypothetical protein
LVLAQLVFTNGYIDLAIEKVEKQRKGYVVNLKNIGGFFAPVDVKIEYEDGTKETIHLTPEAWHKNPNATIVSIPTKKTAKMITLDGGIFMDADMSNNVWKK